MGDVNFYLKKPGANGKSLIFIHFRYQGQRFKYSFGQSVKPANWNAAKQRVKTNKQTTADGHFSLNELLDKLESVLTNAYHSCLAKGTLSNAALKDALDGFINQNSDDPDKPTFYKLLNRFISGEIKYKGAEKSANTISTYKTLLGHLLAFEKVHRWKVDFDTITLDFLYKYLTFLRTTFTEAEINRQTDVKIRKSLSSLPIGQNAIAKDVQIIKTVMKKAITLRLSNSLWFQHEDFAASRVDTDSVYLTDREIMRLYKYPATGSMEQVRDLFVFGCCVGLRYSDYSSVKPENIVPIEETDDEKKENDGKMPYFIKMITAKTKDLVYIPCGPIVLEIFEKYKHNSNKLPKDISNQKFNEGIKKACRAAGLTEKGRLSTNPELELWECVSSHTARRSFATNLYLEAFPVIDLMKITGHRTERSFLRYIRVTKLDAAKRLHKHMIQSWNRKLLRVAS